ncbi:hypothetical protein DFH09DRAFT_1353906 [Mycena vulgaris]|nr:hypothetical protein DFH09DRAFT_1353906 [Mycena vulgaris]
MESPRDSTVVCVVVVWMKRQARDREILLSVKLRLAPATSVAPAPRQSPGARTLLSPPATTSSSLPGAATHPHLPARRRCKPAMCQPTGLVCEHLTTARSMQSVMHTLEEWPLAFRHGTPDRPPAGRGGKPRPVGFALVRFERTQNGGALRLRVVRPLRLSPAAFPSPSSPIVPHSSLLLLLFMPASTSSSPSAALLTPRHFITHSRSATPRTPRRYTLSSTPRNTSPRPRPQGLTFPAATASFIQAFTKARIVAPFTAGTTGTTSLPLDLCRRLTII